MTDAIRIAMWSGPRNVSTALMRSWQSRGDATVVDEPFYAYYLRKTGVPHPIADEVIAAGQTDWRDVVAGLEQSARHRILYVKLMAHHILPEVDRDWLRGFRHCFLIRDPRQMLASLHAAAPNPLVADTGLPQEAELFDRVREGTGVAPPVVDAKDLLTNPAQVLSEMCAALGVDYSDRMLSWEPGPRTSDGIWAPHWYANVEKSSGFRPYQEASVELPPELESVEAECRVIYDRLRAARIGVAP